MSTTDPSRPNSPSDPSRSSTGIAVFLGGLLILVGIILLGNSLGYFYVPSGTIWRVTIGIGLMGLGLWQIVRRQRNAARKEPTFSAPKSATEQSRPMPSESARGTVTPGITNISPLVEPASGTIPSASSGHSGQFNAVTRAITAQKLRYSKVLGDQELTIVGESIEDMEVSFFIGEVLLDLRQARLSPGLNRVIVSGFIGKVSVLVPSDVPIFVRCSNFAGDITALGKRTSGIGNNLDAQNLLYAQSGNRLYIAVNSFLGEISVHTNL